MNKANKKYGIWTGLAMVVGTTLGCGIFIKANSVLNASGGNLAISLLAWLVGGIIMIAGGFCFAIYATKVEKFNGCVDYVEHASNKHIGYYFGYFLGMIYFPVIGSHVAIIGGNYLVRCFSSSFDKTSYPVMLVAFILVTIFSLINYLAPKISSRFQISVLFIKLAPVIFIALIGIIAPAINKDFPGIIGALKTPATKTYGVVSFGEAIKITAFAYDGWVTAAALNAEMKDSKRTLPKAIIGGTIALIIFYLIYFIGLSAVLSNQGVIDAGEFSAGALFLKIFGSSGAIIFMVFIFMSCTGNVNSMTLCTSRSLIALGVRNEGFAPSKMSEVKKGNFTKFPFIFTYLLTIFYLVIWWLVYAKIPVFKYLESMDEMVCALVYLAYIFVYIYMIKNFKDIGIIKRYVMPIIAIIGSVFFVMCGMGIYQLIADKNPASLISFLVFLVFCLIIYIPGIIVHIKKDKNNI